METALNEVLITILQVIVMILVGLACNGVRYATRWLVNKIQSEKATAALNEIEKTVLDGIYYTEQTFVKQIKEEEIWDKDSMSEALMKCSEYVISNLSAECVKQIEASKEDLSRYVIEQIESKMGFLHADTAVLFETSTQE